MTIALKKLQRVGNSTGIVLPPDVLRAAGLSRSDEVMLQVEGSAIVIRRLDPDFDRMVAAADRFVAAHPNAMKKLAQ